MEEVFAKSSTTARVGDYSNCVAQAASFLRPLGYEIAGGNFGLLAVSHM
jgi:hypothetical protein